MANTFKFGNENWAVKDGNVLAYNDENNAFKPLPFTFARSSSATRVDNEGLIKTTDSGFARIDFLNNTSGHLLLEPSSTNLVTYSEDYSQSEWTNSSYTKDATITNNSQSVAPDGTSGVYQYECTVSGSNSQLGALKSITSGVAYTSSFYIKRINGVGNVKIRDVNNTELDITDSLSSDWKRYTITVTSNSTNGRVYVNVLNAGDIIQVWGVQLEQQSYATSYIPTTGSTVTRAAETCNSAGNSTVFNDSEGVLYAEIASLAEAVGNKQFSISNGSNSNHIKFSFRTTENQIQTTVKNSGTTTVNMTTTLSPSVTDFFKVALKYKADDCAMFVNGVKTNTDTSATMTSGLNTFNFDRGDGGNDYIGKVKNIQVYNTALTDAELIELTS